MKLSVGPYGINKEKIFIINQSPFISEDFETIERKGFGHPDTLADKLASLISINYSKYTIDNCDGFILHHQIDKLMIIGGKTEVGFGHGKFVNPIRIVVAGRITNRYLNKKIHVKKLVKKIIFNFFSKNYPILDLNKDIVIENKLTSYPGPGTIEKSKGSIVNMFSPIKKGEIRGYEKLVANDTSYCISYSPLSILEKSIIDLEKYLNSENTKIKYCWLGSDIKIMAVRNYKNVDITICIPQIANFVTSIEKYKQNLSEINSEISKFLKENLSEYKISISINTKDDYNKKNVYLTVSGASLSGDIGVVGRGNRVNGLITSSRPMSLEGSSGKNPRYYSGFIYAILSDIIAKKIYNTFGEHCVVEIVSQNGGPLLRPWRTRIITICKKKKDILRIVYEEFDKIPNITKDFIEGKIDICY